MWPFVFPSNKTFPIVYVHHHSLSSCFKIYWHIQKITSGWNRICSEKRERREKKETDTTTNSYSNIFKWNFVKNTKPIIFGFCYRDNFCIDLNNIFFAIISLWCILFCSFTLLYRWVYVLVWLYLRALLVIWQQQQQQHHHRAVICHRERGKPQKNHKCIESRSKTNQKYAQKYQLELAIYVIKIPMVFFFLLL